MNQTQAYLFALAKAGIDWKRASLSIRPLVCRDPEATPEYHLHVNGCGWRIVDPSSGIVERSGRITKVFRVTEFKAGNQEVLPFGGSFESPEEKAYQFNRWSLFDGRG
jgi:hypothetical protein